jgi:DegV family protein with EDD domain
MIRIVTDSTCEAPRELLQHPSVTVVPLYVLFGQEALKDGVEITQEEFWRRLPSANPLPTTSQPTPADFLAPFRAFTDAGDEIIAVTIASKLSGTHNSAEQAMQQLPQQPIDLVDSLTTSIGEGIMVQEAFRLIEKGASRQEIVATLNQMRERVHVLFSVNTLEYLARGGRLGKGQALMGTLLSVKPMLRIADGELHPAGRVRSRKKALEALVETHEKLTTARGPQVRIGVTHANALDEARGMAETLGRAFNTQDVFIAELGPVLGTHTGPGMIGAGVYAPD